jgi:hypothetical protein
MNKTVNNIPYLCCIADTNEFYGYPSIKFQAWEQKVKMEFSESFLENYEDWIVEKFIPLYTGTVKTDIDVLTLPKVFRVLTNEFLLKIQNAVKQCSMNISVNKRKLLVLVL